MAVTSSIMRALIQVVTHSYLVWSQVDTPSQEGISNTVK